MATAAPRQGSIDMASFLAAGRLYIDRSSDVKSAIDGLLRQAASISGSESASLFLLDASRGVLYPFSLFNIPDSYLAGCAEVPLGTQCCGRAALHKHPWVVEDMWVDPLFEDCQEAAKASGMRAAYSIPVLTEEGSVAASLAFHFREKHSPSGSELERGEWFAQLIAYALKRRASA
jgi:GAF domain-containing protein